jgi:hypothetical protein
MLFFVPPERQPQVRAALAGLVHVSFAFETGGARLIHYDAPNVTPAMDARPAVA